MSNQIVIATTMNRPSRIPAGWQPRSVPVLSDLIISMFLAVACLASPPESLGATLQVATAPPGTRLQFSARAVDAISGQPLHRFRITLGVARDDLGDEGVQWEPDESVLADRGEPAEIDLETLFGRKMRFVASAAGYLPEVSPWYDEHGGDFEFTFRLHPGPGLAGRVVNAAGQPVSNAVVALRSYGHLILSRGTLGRSFNRPHSVTETDGDGRFTLPALIPNPGFVTAHPDHGFAEVTADSLAKDRQIQLVPWASLRGVARNSDGPAAHARLMIDLPLNSSPRFVFLPIDEYEVTTNDRGEFEIGRVPPRLMELRLSETNGLTSRHLVSLAPRPNGPDAEHRITLESPSRR